MKMICVHSAKGGVGKTTLSTQLAIAATKRGYKVAFFDLDPQLTALDYFQTLKQTYPIYLLNKQDFDKGEVFDADFIVLDCPPGVSFIPPEAFTVVRPLRASGVDFKSAMSLNGALKNHQVIDVINFFDPRTKTDREVAQELKNFVPVRSSRKFLNALTYGTTVFDSAETRREANQINYLLDRALAGSAETIDEALIYKIPLNQN